MAKKKHNPGTFVRIRLQDGSYGYGRLLEFPFIAFYDYRSTEPVSDLDALAAKPVAFTIAVHKSAVDTWEVIGQKPPEPNLKPPMRFMQTIGDPADCQIFDSEGNERPAKPEECVGLERVAVWEPNHVEDRLLDMFMNRPNKWVEQLKVKLPG
jgi:hypothetical protein